MRAFCVYMCVALGVFALAEGAVTAQPRISRSEYVKIYSEWAVREMLRSGIPASITLAQGILESDCGNAPLAMEANNHFGIKCHNDWTGGKIYHDDDRKHECFRKYDNAEESFRDHTFFLVSKSRYQKLFSLKPTDYKGWAKGLRECGYATDPGYAKKLIDIIEAEKLYRYDADKKDAKTTDEPAAGAKDKTHPAPATKAKRGQVQFVINPQSRHTVQKNNRTRYVALRPGDTLDRIAKEFNMTVGDLLRYNEMSPDADLSAMKYIYLERKRRRSDRTCPTHTVAKGDTPWSIAQKYGVRLSKILKRNGLSATDTPAAGTQLKLR